MSEWKNRIKYDPIKQLLSSNNKAIPYFSRRDLLDEAPKSIDMRTNPKVTRLLKKQKDDGSWKPVKDIGYPPSNKILVETFRNLRLLVRRYELDNQCIQVKKASEYLFKWQTSQGDFRGFIGDQYAPYYTGEVMAILILAGYTKDVRIHKGFQWLLSMRQDDGGWTIPMLTHKLDRETSYRATSEPWVPYEPIRSMPSSHNWTDMVLRTFAVHPEYRMTCNAHKAAGLLKSRFFKPDLYGSYRDEGYWVRFQFWWPNIVTSLDSLSLMGFSINDQDLLRAVDWLIENQLSNGLWRTSYKKGDKQGETSKEQENEEWLSLQICRILKRLI